MVATLLSISFKSEALPFDDASVRLVARAYALSMPLLFEENELIPLMAANKTDFLAGGRAIIYMQALGTALVQAGVAAGAQINSDPSVSKKFGGLMPPGLESLPAQADAQMRSRANGLIMVGQELLWLSQVLPPAANGDYNLYNTTATPFRQQLIAQVPTYRIYAQYPGGLAMIQQQELLAENTIYNLAIQVFK
jgi:hypothetical protein